MDEYLRIEIENGRLRIKVLKEITTEDFLPCAMGEGNVVVSYISLILDETAWIFNKGENEHTGTLTIGFRFALDLKTKIDELQKEGLSVDQFTLVQLMGLFKAYEARVRFPVKGRTEAAREKAFEDMKSTALPYEKKLYDKALSSFMKAVNTINEM